MGGNSLFDKLESDLQTRLLAQESNERLTNSYRYEGDFVFVLPEGIFTRAEGLEEKYPAVNGKIFVDVPIKGMLEELTQEQADQFYDLGGR